LVIAFYFYLFAIADSSAISNLIDDYYLNGNRGGSLGSVGCEFGVVAMEVGGCGPAEREC